MSKIPKVCFKYTVISMFFLYFCNKVIILLTLKDYKKVQNEETIKSGKFSKI